MRWIPPVNDTVQAYNTFTFSWSGVGTRLYTTRLNTPAGTVSSTAPTSAAEALEFVVPDACDFYGIELFGQKVSGTLANPTTVPLHKIEVWSTCEGYTSSDVTLTIDSGLLGAPWLYASNGTSAAYRRYIDIGGQTWNNRVFYDVAALGTQGHKRHETIIFSNLNSGPPYAVGLKRIFLIFSHQWGEAQTTSYSLKIVPFAAKIGTRDSGL